LTSDTPWRDSVKLTVALRRSSSVAVTADVAEGRIHEAGEGRDRLVHHCHIVTIRGNSYRMRQHTDLWHTLHAPDPEPSSNRRRRPRQEAATN